MKRDIAAEIEVRAARLNVRARSDADLSEAEWEIEETLRHDGDADLEITYSAICAEIERREEARR